MILSESKRRPAPTQAEAEDRLEWRLSRGAEKKPHYFAAPAALLKGFWKKSGVREDRVAILGAIWDREVGAFKDHWRLDAVRGSAIHVRVRSSASAQELALRSSELVKGLNKHFLKPWIKTIRFKVGSAGK